MIKIEKEDGAVEYFLIGGLRKDEKCDLSRAKNIAISHHPYIHSVKPLNDIIECE